MDNKIVAIDVRSKELETLRRVNQIGNDRFICMSAVTGIPYRFVLSKSKHIDEFELRKPEQPLMSVRHFC